MLRQSMVLFVSLVALWHAGCRVDVRELRPLHATLPASPDRELAAAASTDNVLTVATLEPSGEDKYVLRVITFHRPNGEVSQREIRLKGFLLTDVRVFDRNNRRYVGWLEDAHRLCLALLGDGPLRREILLEDPDAYLGDWWIVGQGPQTRLLVQKQEVLKPSFKKEEFLCAYMFRENEANFVEKILLEEEGYPASSLACASGKDRIILWQVHGSRKRVDIMKDPGAVDPLDVETLRAGVWQEGRGVQWKSRYIGNDPLMLSVDSKNGAACAVSEWKGAQKGSSIAVLMMLESTKLIPLGTSDRLGLRVRLVWLGGPDVCWAVLLRKPGGDTVVQWFDAEFRPISSVVLGRENVVAPLVTAGKDGATNIVTLTKDEIHLRTFVVVHRP